MITLRQIRSVIAVFEEGSFTRAATRENATQSGVSQHIAAVEASLGVTLFERETGGVHPTAAGKRYYEQAVQALRNLDAAAGEARAAAVGTSGPVFAGLMPAFTRAALAPVLDRFMGAHPNIDVKVIEGYSGALTDMVRAQSLDFALVPASTANVGLSVTHLVRDREMLISGAGQGLPHGAPVILSELDPINLIAPTRSNVRRQKLEEYIETHNVRIHRLLEMDAMMGTLELVALGDWVSILPGLLCANDSDGSVRHVAPVDAPPLYSEFVMIEPARKPLSPQAAALFEAMRDEIVRLASG